MHSNTSIFLLKVAVHELGHSFGLYHSTDINDVMYPSYQPNEEVNITPDTIAGIVKLYGAVTPVNPDIPCPEGVDAKEIYKELWGEMKWYRISRPELNKAAIRLGLNPKDYRNRKTLWAEIVS